MKGSEFVFDYVCSFIYFKYHILSLNCGRSYIDSADWIKNEKATLNLFNMSNCEKRVVLFMIPNGEW